MATVLSELEFLSLDSMPMVVSQQALVDSEPMECYAATLLLDRATEDLIKMGFDPAELMHEALGKLYGNKKPDVLAKYKALVHMISTKPALYFHKSVRDCLDELKNLQEQHDCFESQYYDNIYKIEANYLREIEPLCSKRMHLVRTINQFWLSVLRDDLNMEITEWDEMALVYLKDIKYTLLSNPWGSKIEFVFDPNPYFENLILTKEIRYTWSRGNQLPTAIKGTDIKWYRGQMIKEQSFFNFFSEMEDFDCNQVTIELKRDLRFSEYFIKWVIPHALSIFLVCSNRVVDELRELQMQFDAYNLKMSEEKLTAEAIYLEYVEPLHKRRAELVAECMVAELSPSGEEYLDVVPEFWLYAIKGEKSISSKISYRDAKVLRYLKDIKCSRLVGNSGWKYEFFFNPNPYFENSVLTKTFDTLKYKWKTAVVQSTGTVIQWRPSDLFAKDEDRVKGFFSLFNGSEKDGHSEKDLGLHCYICSIFRGTIVPHAASFYLDQKHFDYSLKCAWEQCFVLAKSRMQKL